MTPDHPIFRLVGAGRSGGGAEESTASTPDPILAGMREALQRALTGEGAHVGAQKALDGLDRRLASARPEGAPHSAFQIVNHLVFWHDHALAWLAGEKPATPAHDADSWPGPPAPASEAEWQGTVARFAGGLDLLRRHAREDDLLARRGPKSVLYILQISAAHDGYHLGQVVLLRQQLGAWPPPGGGFTW